MKEVCKTWMNMLLAFQLFFQFLFPPWWFPTLKNQTALACFQSHAQNPFAMRAIYHKQILTFPNLSKTGILIRLILPTFAFDDNVISKLLILLFNNFSSTFQSKIKAPKIATFFFSLSTSNPCCKSLFS